MLFKNWYYLSVHMTAPEKALEAEIAKMGQRYRAQWLFPKYRHIADFVLVDMRIIIEVDGDSHLKEDQIRKDLVHTIALERDGFAVVRVSNEDALNNPKGVVDMLHYLCATRPSLAELEESLASLPPPAPKKPRRSASTRKSKRPRSPAVG